jgi:hypothetical protein
MVAAHLLINQPAGGILEYFFQMFHQNLGVIFSLVS